MQQTFSKIHVKHISGSCLRLSGHWNSDLGAWFCTMVRNSVFIYLCQNSDWVNCSESTCSKPLARFMWNTSLEVASDHLGTRLVRNSVLTIGYVVLQFIRASESQVSQSLTLSSDFQWQYLSMHGIQRLAMLTNNSACISTIWYVVLQFIRASECWPQCLKVWP